MMTGKNKILIIGGCRSGKSGHALALAEAMGPRRVFVATCIPHDDEMRDRVARHQKERSEAWSTLEIPVALPEAIRRHSPPPDVMLVDCLTLWMNNLLMETEDVETIRRRIDDLAGAVSDAPHAVVLVSNEVGTGIVPENRLARLYRDLVGWTNQAVAAVCDRVIWTVAGIPVTVKPPIQAPIP
jgi:adenosylcobinamide kinase/adenosylcobinamide-phosphate guanylyltransferase